jgi:tetratricopeptide (TPR) repeat protein
VPLLDVPVDRSALERVTPRVLELYEEHILPARVLHAISLEPWPTPADRETAGRVGAVLPHPNPNVLNNQCWELVKSSGSPAAKYQLGLRKIEAACALSPPDANYLHTLGVTLYRLERYSDALAALWHSERLNALLPSPFNSSINVIFIAMCEAQLGRKPEAAFLHKAALSLEGENPGPDMVGFLLEASNLIAQPEEWGPTLESVLRAFEEGLTLARVEERVLTDISLTEVSRALGLRVARALGDLTRAMLLTLSRHAADENVEVSKGELERALRQTEAACALAPRDWGSQIRLGVIRLRLGRYVEALVALAAIPTDSDSMPPREIARIAILNARSHAGLGDYRRGITILEEALAKLPLQLPIRAEIEAVLANLRVDPTR